MSLYLDYNATAPLCPEAKAAMLDGMSYVGNGSSVHQFGRGVRQKIDQARLEIAGFFKASPAGVVFTSGATEANHLALCGFQGHVITSAIEHDSVDQARPNRTVCPVTADGVIDVTVLEDLLQQNDGKPTMVSLMAANNETGIVQPLDQVASLAKCYGAFVHCDAAQAVGRLPLGWDGIDLVSLSAHKLGGPQGVGALLMRTEVPLVAQMRGGGQERSFRSGTENFLGILGFAAALKGAASHNWGAVEVLRDTLETCVEVQQPGSVLFKGRHRLPNTAVIVMKGVQSATQVMNFDLRGIAVSAGSACSSGKVKSSRVLKAMGIPDDLADCSIRVSLGPVNAPDLVDRFVQVWREISGRAVRSG